MKTILKIYKYLFVYKPEFDPFLEMKETAKNIKPLICEPHKLYNCTKCLNL